MRRAPAAGDAPAAGAPRRAAPLGRARALAAARMPLARGRRGRPFGQRSASAARRLRSGTAAGLGPARPFGGKSRTARRPVVRARASAHPDHLGTPRSRHPTRARRPGPAVEQRRALAARRLRSGTAAGLGPARPFGGKSRTARRPVVRASASAHPGYLRHHQQPHRAAGTARRAHGQGWPFGQAPRIRASPQRPNGPRPGHSAGRPAARGARILASASAHAGLFGTIAQQAPRRAQRPGPPGPARQRTPTTSGTASG